MSSSSTSERRLFAPRPLVWIALVAIAGAAACSDPSPELPPFELFSEMDRQPKYQAQGASLFFEDGQASRPPIRGTVARGQLKADDVFYRGRRGGTFVDEGPIAVTDALLDEGRLRYNAYCAPCHDTSGSGRGPVAVRAEWEATPLGEDRLRAMPDGELFDVISRGRRSMRGYRNVIVERDRWAIVAYVRILQSAMPLVNEAER